MKASLAWFVDLPAAALRERERQLTPLSEACRAWVDLRHTQKLTFKAMTSLSEPIGAQLEMRAAERGVTIGALIREFVIKGLADE